MKQLNFTCRKAIHNYKYWFCYHIINLLIMHFVLYSNDIFLRKFIYLPLNHYCGFINLTKNSYLRFFFSRNVYDIRKTLNYFHISKESFHDFFFKAFQIKKKKSVP